MADEELTGDEVEGEGLGGPGAALRRAAGRCAGQRGDGVGQIAPATGKMLWGGGAKALTEEDASPLSPLAATVETTSQRVPLVEE